jgi:hypothetical protein
MVKATRRLMFLAEALKQRISDVGGDTGLAMERIKADMDAHRLEVTWEDRDGATYTNVLPAGCDAWAKATIDWSRSTARWYRDPEVRLVPQLEYIEKHKWAFCVKVRTAQARPTTAAAETRWQDPHGLNLSLQRERPVLTLSCHRLCIAARANVQFPRAQPLEASGSGNR